MRPEYPRAECCITSRTCASWFVDCWSGLLERPVEDTNNRCARCDDGEPGSYTRAYIVSTCRH